MRTIVHLSDLHFGRIDPAILAPLRAAVRELAPHLIAVSGDLTQRARSRQFAQARHFLDSLPAHKVVVPGNHDVPLYNVVARFARPLANYRRHISRDVEPAYVDDEIAVVGINTARSLVFKGGRVNVHQVERVRRVFRAASSGLTRILVTHHPFDLPEGHDEDHLVGRASMAMNALRDCAPDILLSGHLHVSNVETTAERYDLGGTTSLVVQAGTATSTRGRGERNSFNVLHIDAPSIEVRRFEWDAARRDFVAVSSATFERQGKDWVAPSA